MSKMDIEAPPFEIVVDELESDIQDYMAVYKDILRDLVESAKSSNSDVTAEWYKKCLKHNVPGSSKHMYGLAAVLIYKGLVQKRQLKAENLKLAQYLGWCVELFHSTIYVSDDVMDQSSTRRDQMCWYKLKDACFTTPTDVVMIENGIYVLLRKHFRHFECYVDLVELFHKLMFQAANGQLLDYLISKKSVSTFNMETYKSIVMNKTGCQMLYLPTAMALNLAGVKDPKIFEQYRRILADIAVFSQVQNDFLDCYINPDITGRIGTDIEENKCSWLAVVCMERANAEQKAIMVECYGKNDPQKVARVRKLYDEMNIQDLYVAYEKETYKNFKMRIAQASGVLSKEALINVLNFLIKDNKVNQL